MRGQNNACAAVHAGQFFDCNRVAQNIKLRSAVFFRIGNSHQTEFRHLGYCLVGEFIALIQLKRNRLDFLLCKRSDLSPELFMSLRSFKKHLSVTSRIHKSSCISGVPAGQPDKS